MGINPKATALAARLNKQYGEGTVIKASDIHIPRRYTSGSLSIDLSLGGGWPANQWVEIYGPESHGKTAITLKTLAANQASNPTLSTLWIASEHYDLEQAVALGVDTDRVQVVDTRDAAFAYDMILAYLEERAVDIVVLDSYPALTTPDEAEKDMDEYTIAEGAKLTNKFFRKVGRAGKRDPLNDEDAPWLGIFINQPREKPGWSPTGQPIETTPGGRGKNFAFYTRLMVKRAEWIEQKVPGKGKTKVGQTIRTRTIKNKAAPPERVGSVDFYFTDAPFLGFKRGDYDTAKDIVTMGVMFDVIARRSPKSAQYDFEGMTFNGMPSLLKAVGDDQELQQMLVKAVTLRANSPHDKRTWSEEDVESASARQVVSRVRKKEADDD